MTDILNLLKNEDPLYVMETVERVIHADDRLFALLTEKETIDRAIEAGLVSASRLAAGISRVATWRELILAQNISDAISSLRTNSALFHYTVGLIALICAIIGSEETQEGGEGRG